MKHAVEYFVAVFFCVCAYLLDVAVCSLPHVVELDHTG